MIASRSAMASASCWSWVTWMAVMCSRRSSSASSSRSDSFSLASRAVSGSSSSSTRGRTATARARATRWRWPPDSSAGRLLLQAVETDQVDQFADPAPTLGLGDAADAQAVADVGRHRHLRKQRIVLEHHADAALSRSGAAVTSSSPKQDAAAGVGALPARRSGAAAWSCRSRTGPSSASTSPGSTASVVGCRRAGAVGIGLGAVDHVDAGDVFRFHSASRTGEPAIAAPRALAGRQRRRRACRPSRSRAASTRSCRPGRPAGCGSAGCAASRSG